MTFAQIHCQTCDARFSCRSYRAYQKGEGGRPRAQTLPAVRDEAAERELEAWIGREKWGQTPKSPDKRLNDVQFG